MIVTATNRLIIRHFHILDAEWLQQVFTDAEVMRFGPGVQTRQWIDDWLQRCLTQYHTWGFGPWAVVRKDSHETIGYCGLFYFPAVAGQPEVEVGYRLARACWGQGYASEAVVAARDYAFNVLSLPRLIAMIDPQNIASIRVAEKAGLRYEKDMMFEGYTHPDGVYALANPFASPPDPLSTA